MKTQHSNKLVTLVFLLFCSCQTTSGIAAIVIQVDEIPVSEGGFVQFVGSGTVNLTDLTVQRSGFSLLSYGNPSDGTLQFGGSGELADEYSGVTFPSSYGTGGFFFLSRLGSGNAFGLVPNAFNGDLIFLPSKYSSGSTISVSGRVSFASFDSLGLTDGDQYVWSWGTADNFDTVTLNIGDVTSVPEPGSTLSLLALFSAFAICRRNQRRYLVSLRTASRI